MLVWVLTLVLSVLALTGAAMLENVGADLAAAVITATIPLLVAGAMKLTWRWVTG